jgi:YVTN family beta-propeller protein
MRRSRSSSGWLSRIAVGFAATILILTAVVAFHGTVATSGAILWSDPSAVRVPQDPRGDAGSFPSAAGLSLVGSIPVDSAPIGVAYDSRDANLDVLLFSNNLTVVRASNDSVVAQIALPPGYIIYPVTETYDARDNIIYVTQEAEGVCTGCGGPVTDAINGSTGQVVATNTSLMGIDVSDYLDCLGFDPENGIVYACDSFPGKLVLYEGASDTILRSITVGSLPSSMTYDPANGEVYVTNWGSNNVTVIDAASSRTVGSVAVGSQPDGITFDSANGFLYVANNASDSVTVIDGRSNTVLTSVSVGCNPGAVVYDSFNGNVYVANTCSNNLTAISGATNTVVGAVPVGSYPDAIAYDDANNRVYVANDGSSNVTVLATIPPPTKYAVTFTQSGLPLGSNWSVDLNSTHLSSVGPSIVFSEPNGTYSYSVPPVGFFAAVFDTGQIRVNASSVNLSVRFAYTALLRFEVDGLPAGENWSVEVANATVGVSIHDYETGPGVGFQLFANVTYAYSVALPENYSSWDVTGNVTLPHAGTVIDVSIERGSAGVGLPWWTQAGIVATIAAVAVVAAIVVLWHRSSKGSDPGHPAGSPSFRERGLL